MNQTLLRAAAAALAAGLAASSASAAFVIDVNYTGDPMFRPAFDDAAALWESKLNGYQDAVVTNTSVGSSYAAGDTIDTLFINASVAPIDGPFGVLGSAGPTSIVSNAGGGILASDGVMDFDSDDINMLFQSGDLADVVAHEMAHVMGFGTLFNANNLIAAGSGPFLRFTGANAVAAWGTEFGQFGDLNLEDEGGPGTANGHWDELFGNSNAVTGITVTDPASPNFGRDLTNEIMTGRLDGPVFVSDMTIAAFVDLGFTAASVPEPTALAMLGLVGLGLRRRR